MTAINITSVNVLDNPALFVNPFQFEIQYECLQDLQHGERPRTAPREPYLSEKRANAAVLSVMPYWLPRVPHKLP